MRNNFLYNKDFNGLVDKMRKDGVGAILQDITEFYMDHYSLPTDCSREPEDGVEEDDDDNWDSWVDHRDGWDGLDGEEDENE